MKKFLAFLSLLIILFCLIAIPLSASSIYTPEWDYPYLNQYPEFLGFSSIEQESSLDNKLDFSFSDLSPYLFGTHEQYACLFFMFVDVDYFEVIPSSSLSITLTQYSSTDSDYTLSSSFSSSLITFYPNDSGYYDRVSVSISNYSPGYYCSIIPLSTDVPSNQNYLISSIRDSYAALSYYERGFTDGLSTGASYNYSKGLEDGYAQANRDFASAYNSGFDDGSSDAAQRGYEYGYSDGRSDGYTSGYNEGFSDSNQKLIRNSVLYVVSAPFIAISNFLNFEIFGINFRLIFAFVFGCCILAFVIKHFVR